jgi:hypothetical protein
VHVVSVWSERFHYLDFNTFNAQITAGILTNASNSGRDTIAVHGTCYELKSKVNGLKVLTAPLST